jgi:murein DD-endopeptidase MepM/ murein hydrolase activator NlpD
MFDFAKGGSDGPDVYIHPIPGYSEPNSPKIFKVIFTLLITVLIVAGLGVGGYFLYQRIMEERPPTQNTQPTERTTQVSPVAESTKPKVPVTPTETRQSPVNEETLTEPPAVFEPPEPPVIKPIKPKQEEIVSQIEPIEPAQPVEPENTEPEPKPEEPAVVTAEEQETVPPTTSKEQWLEQIVENGDTLSHIFERFGLSSTLMLRITHSSNEAKTLAKIRQGQKIKVLMDAEGKFKQLIWIKNAIESLIIEETEDGFETRKEKKKIETRNGHATGVITSSLFLDGQKAGLSDGIIMKMAEIFGWDIDFALGIRSGDRFTVIYEEQYIEGEKCNDGAILAAEFINRNTRYRAIRFEDPSGEVGYYTPDGKGMRKDFLMTPVEFTRISSGFTPKRWHPVLKKWRSHKGVDYAAPKGTPIMATANGKITYSGWKGGYGRVVIIKHRNKYTTVYGHMSGFSRIAKTGNLVKQGQVIGYVGKSGLATGPHLHYELRINGAHKDPLTVKFQPSRPIPSKYYLEFMDYSNNLIAQLSLISSSPS